MNRQDAELIYDLVTRVVCSAVVGLNDGVIHPESAAKIREARKEFFAAAVTPKTPEDRIAEYERILKRIVHDINNALGFVNSGTPPNEPFGLDYRTLKHWIDEALK